MRRRSSSNCTHHLTLHSTYVQPPRYLCSCARHQSTIGCGRSLTPTTYRPPLVCSYHDSHTLTTCSVMLTVCGQSRGPRQVESGRRRGAGRTCEMCVVSIYLFSLSLTIDQHALGSTTDVRKPRTTSEYVLGIVPIF